MTDTQPLTDQQLDEIAERLSEARLVADKADWMLQDYQVVRQQQADAAALLAEVHRLRVELAAETAPFHLHSATAIADADNPTQLRWGLDDVMWGDDDSVTVLLSGPAGEPYWLELDPERAAVLRDSLAGPDGEQPAADVGPETGTGQCGHDDYHDPHEWADRPGMWCPGHSVTTPAVSPAV